MKLLYTITRGDEMGGAQHHVVDLATAMHDRGHEVLVAHGGAGALEAALAGSGVTTRRVPQLVRPVHPSKDLGAALALGRLVRQWRPDLLHAHSSKAGTVARLVGRLTGVPTVFTAHGWAFTEGVPPARRWLAQVTEGAMRPFTDLAITVSDYDRELAVRSRVLPRSRLLTIHNGVRDPTVPAPRKHAPGRWVMVGRFAAPKRQDHVIRALTRTTDAGLTIDFIGDGPSRGDAEALARALGQAHRVRFLGAIPDAAHLLPAYHGLVLASDWEGFPLVVLEAMRAGLPVVATDVGGVREAVSDGRTGLLVPPDSPPRIAAALDTLAARPGLAERMGRDGRGRFEAHFTSARMVDQTLAAYARLLGGAEDAAWTGAR